MTCDELRPDYLLYAMGVLEEPEKAELRAHLDRGCESCTAGIREARQCASAIGASAAGPEPSRGLRNRVLAIAGTASETKSRWWAVWLAPAAVALVAVGAILYQGQLKDAELAQVREQLARSDVESAGLRSALALLQAPETREVTFGQAAPAPPRGRVFFNPSSVLLIASNLPAPPPARPTRCGSFPKAASPSPRGCLPPTRRAPPTTSTPRALPSRQPTPSRSLSRLPPASTRPLPSLSSAFSCKHRKIFSARTSGRIASRVLIG